MLSLTKTISPVLAWAKIGNFSFEQGENEKMPMIFLEVL